MAIIRIEQLYPYPHEEVRLILSEFSHVIDFVVAKEWKVVSNARSFVSGTSLKRRSRISAATFQVNVKHRMRKDSFFPCSTNRATRAVNVAVLPDPGPAKTSNGPSFHCAAVD